MSKNVLELFQLSGKTALVTGCKRGIGLAMAIGLAEAGADIVGVSATLEPSGSEVERAVKATGRSFRAYQADFSDRQALHGFITRLREDVPRIDILVNNAGTIVRKPAADHPDEGWDHVIEVNLNAQFVLTREIGGDMMRRGNGKIIFTASLLSFQGGINVISYAAAKHGVAGLTKAFANEWAGHGVQVNAITPGYISTSLTQSLEADPDRAPAILARIPAGRWGQPDDFKGPVVFLASAASDYVSGEILVVDGGWMAR